MTIAKCPLETFSLCLLVAVLFATVFADVPTVSLFSTFSISTSQNTCLFQTPANVTYTVTSYKDRQGFAIRVAPREIGIHVISCIDQYVIFNATLETNDVGYISVGSNHRHLIDSKHSVYIPRGFNIAWPSCSPGTCSVEESIAYYDAYFSKMSKVGANYVRLWLGPNIVSSFNSLTMLSTYNTINLDAAEAVDGILLSAQRHGIKVLMSFDSFNSLCPNFANGECWYDASVWNARNGGPLAPIVGFLKFWSDPTTVKAWLSYQSYIVARWSAFSSVLAWQLFNEVDAAAFDVIPSSYHWHRQVATALRDLDIYHHIVSESFGFAVGNFILDNYDVFDITTTHYYARTDRGGSSNVGKASSMWTLFKTFVYKKPNFVGEFGCNDDKHQPLSRAALHDGMWASIFAGSAGSGTFWYWDSIPEAWWMSEFSALHTFLSGLPYDISSFDWLPLIAHHLPYTVESVGLQGRLNNSTDVQFILLWLHNLNGTEPCSQPATSLVAPFSLDLFVKSHHHTLEWKFYFLNSATGLPLSSPTTATSSSVLTISTPEFISDIILVAYV